MFPQHMSLLEGKYALLVSSSRLVALEDDMMHDECCPVSHEIVYPALPRVSLTISSIKNLRFTISCSVAATMTVCV